MRRIWIANERRYATVDDEDYNRASQLKWSVYERYKGMCCIADTYPINGRHSTITMQSLIMKTSRRVSQINTTGLDFRKSNLSFYKHNIIGKMTDELKAFILGTLLGDASSHINHNKYGERRFGLRCTHGEKQRDYLFHKARLLSAYMKAGPRRSTQVRRAGYKKRHSWSFGTCVCSDFDFLDMCYDRNHKKYVSQKWVDNLTLASLAYWYMDDGYLSDGRWCHFSTCSFSIVECNRLAGKLKRMGFHSWVFVNRPTIKGIKKCYPIIRMESSSSKEFLKQIGHLVPKCLKYKCRFRETKTNQCSFCGDAIKAFKHKKTTKWRIRSCSKKECEKKWFKHRNKTYYKENKEWLGKKKKEYYNNNRELIKKRNRESAKKYYAENRERINETRRTRRAKKRKVKKAG